MINKIIKIIKYLTNPKKILIALMNLNFLNFISDKQYLKLKYKLIMGEKLDLDNPKTFNEKMQWLKLYDRKDIYTTMVDKYEVKKYVSSILGEQYVIPTLGIYDSFDDIDFDKLPNQFVIKCTHDSGGLIVCEDKNKLDLKTARKKINHYLKRKYYYVHREWPYKNVKPRIIIEEFMSNNGEELEDYKVHNFNGKSKIILVCKDRRKKSGLTEDFFDVDWNHLNISRENHGHSSVVIERPVKLDEILELSEKLAKDINFVRTDFYIIDGKVYFGEITFYPASGLKKFIPDEWNKKLGKMLKLPIEKD